MSASRKVAVVITSRASYARIKSVLAAVDSDPRLELYVIACASMLLDRYGSAVKVAEADGFTPVATVYMTLEGENPVSMAKTTGLGIIELTTVLNGLRPDVVVTIADRYETLATAVAASYLNIPVAHVQGGEITGSIDEKVRHAITKLSNLHLVSNKNAEARVLQMGEAPCSVYVTGCPSIDLAKAVIESDRHANSSLATYGGVGADFSLSEPYLIVMQHPVTTEHEKSREQIAETLHAVRRLGVRTLWFWPNSDAGSDGISKGIRIFREHEEAPNVRFVKNMPPEDFLVLLRGASCLIGNSSVGIRESSYLGTPVVNIGGRQAGRLRGCNVLDVTHDQHLIEAAIRQQIAVGRYASETLYGDGSSGERIADVLATAELSHVKVFHDFQAPVEVEE